MTNNVLLITASVRQDGSHSRKLSQQILSHISPTEIVKRDISEGLPMISDDWVAANQTPAENRTDAQNALLSLSDSLIAEIKAADTILFAFPVYNFGLPAALKAWADLVCRMGETFTYSEAGPSGLLASKRAIMAVSSGYTEVGGEGDYASTQLAYILGFLGITDVQIVSEDRTIFGLDEAQARAMKQIADLSL